MPINFLQLLEESWNFIRNQTQFSIIAVGLFLSLSIFNLYMAEQFTSVTLETTQGQSLLAIILSLLNLYVSVLIILNIKAINDGSFRHFFQSVGMALARLPAAIGVSMLAVLPLSLGASSIIVGNMMGNGVSVVGLPLLVFGIYIFLRLCPALYATLIENLPVMQAVKLTWRLTKGKMLVMIGYAIFAYLIPQLLPALLSNLGKNLIFQIISIGSSIFFALFLTIFGFRFYQVLRQSYEG